MTTRTEKAGRGKPGRPRSAAKARSILKAATELFTHRGFEATSVDDIATAAGVSKQTVYTHFGSKEDLFGVAISNKCKTSGIDPQTVDPEIPPERMLPELARRFLKLVTSDEAVSVNAICSVSCESHPELARLYFERGPLETVQVVADYLAAQHRAGRLSVDDPEHAAWQFLGMLKAEAQMRAQFRLQPVSNARQRAYEASCVELFLRAYAPPAAPSDPSAG
jgi:AcrR family transcriptional regulator